MRLNKIKMATIITWQHTGRITLNEINDKSYSRHVFCLFIFKILYCGIYIGIYSKQRFWYNLIIHQLGKIFRDKIGTEGERERQSRIAK